MKRSEVTGQRLVAIFLGGGMLLNYPILSLVAGPRTIAGIPATYAFVFGAWAFVIGLMALVIERRRD